MRRKIEGNALLGQLEVVKEGRTVYLADDSADALDFATVLSLPYALERVLPDLSKLVTRLD